MNANNATSIQLNHITTNQSAQPNQPTSAWPRARATTNNMYTCKRIRRGARLTQSEGEPRGTKANKETTKRTNKQTNKLTQTSNKQTITNEKANTPNSQNATASHPSVNQGNGARRVRRLVPQDLRQLREQPHELAALCSERQRNK